MFMNPIYQLVIAIAVFNIPTSTFASTILIADYETGEMTSGITGLTPTKAAAPDAASIETDYARSGNFAISHKVVLDDEAYISSGSPRSESDTLSILNTRYEPGMHRKYEFSFLLKDWEDWGGVFIPNDIIWQFKHTQGGPDASFGIKRNSLVFRYAGTTQINIIDDMRPFDNKWIDLQTEVLWADDETGHIKVFVKNEDQETFSQVVDITNSKTFTDQATGDFGYLKWGLYRPDSTSANNSITRIIYHDNIKISAIPEPSTPLLFILSALGFASIQRRRTSPRNSLSNLKKLHNLVPYFK